MEDEGGPTHRLQVYDAHLYEARRSLTCFTVRLTLSDRHSLCDCRVGSRATCTRVNTYMMMPVVPLYMASNNIACPWPLIRSAYKARSSESHRVQPAAVNHPLDCLLDVFSRNTSFFRSPNSGRQKSVLLWVCASGATRCDIVLVPIKTGLLPRVTDLWLQIQYPAEEQG